MKIQKRRTFIKQSALYAFSVSAFGMAACNKDDDPIQMEEDLCRTTGDILGPFYRANAPIREDLTIPGHDAPGLLVRGVVFKEDCTSILAGVQVEFWQSDSDGNYDEESEAFRFYGRLISGQDGAYSFKTIVPGRYLNGSTYRPSHIHFRITAHGYRELVSQIYFKDDPYIASDPWASRPAAQQRILEISADDQGIDTVHFPIYMSKI